MLNEWSDREPPKPPRPFIMTLEFWGGVFTVFMSGALLVSFAASLFHHIGPK
jgi:hypothetical protein